MALTGDETRSHISRKDWMERFATQFLAIYAANMYYNTCIRGEYKRLYNLPIEDAFDIAAELPLFLGYLSH